jgi:HAD superfamily hydrolase (TIGR01509 family)
MVTLPRAVVFDCDGTIADTESISGRAWRDTLAEFGVAMDDDDHRGIVGRTWPTTWTYFASRHELGDPQVFRRLLRRRYLDEMARGIDVYDDAIATIRALAEADVALAVATSSGRAHVERVLESGGIRDLIQAVVSAEDVDRPKPDPAPYRRAVESLGVDPADASAVEDTPVGVASAVGAGLFTVAVVRILWESAELGGAHRVVDEITVEAVVPAMAGGADDAGAEDAGADEVPGFGDRSR